MSGHTEGKLRVVGTAIMFAGNAGGFDIRNCPDAEANARRLAACWNALADVDFAFIECMPQFPGITVIQLLRKERDELLAQKDSKHG